MREILFRGKRISNGEWVEGSLLVWPDGDAEICHTKPDAVHEMLKAVVRPKTVGQFTGLTDKNGRWIFEGDIIPVWEQGEEYPYKVIYCGDCFMLSMLDSEQGSYPLSVKCNASEVIGNIHDNPELLGGGEGG